MTQNGLDYAAPEGLLTGRVILVTGASDGIGRAAAQTYASLGATVVLLGRDLQKLEQVYDAIEKAGHPQPAIIPMNFSSATQADFDQLAVSIEQELGRLDGILHSAGLLGDITPLEMYDPDTWDDIMKVNLRAPFVLTQTLLPLLKRSPDASVIFVSSSVGRKARAFWGAYAVSKSGVEALSALFADEMTNISQIRFNCVNPGGTRTAMRARAYPAENPATVKSPEEIMPVFTWLMGPDSRGVTGQSLDAQPPRQA
ncbi:MAG: YciK family oxidoreductase [Fluviicoccus sp.]|uniref:YciK family oxidoreductase n=1 Tax=Fluviicoccus sp. TaxID=2003552 RepID=UPI002715C1D3|nr:YciK family oxidoreductase [Fluviicoccus sp.]MDO8331828.1 YciK family oxidoreductase [Fluviicoccus sp.]